MSFQDPISDCLTRIRNGLMRGKDQVSIPYSKLKFELVNVLVDEGYLKSCDKSEENNKPIIEVGLKYFNESPVIKELKRISTPGRRVYLGVDNLPKVRQGLGVAIVSTSKGIMSDSQARQSRVGGEVLCTVF